MHKKMTTRTEKGFTLIEVLIVVALLGLFASIAIPYLIDFIGKGTVESANTEAHNVQVAVISYILEVKLDNGEDLTDLTGTVGYNGTTSGDLNDKIDPYIITDMNEIQALYYIIHGVISSADPDPNGKWSNLTWVVNRWE